MVICPKCKSRLNIHSEMLGKLIRCNQCKKILNVPNAVEATLPPYFQPQPNLPAQKSSSSIISNNNQDTRNSVDEAGETSTFTASERGASEEVGFLRAAQKDDEIGRLGNYRILKTLGQGGMGMVFLAEDIALKRKVALKVIRPGLASSQSKQRFLLEAQAAAAIDHAHVITIYQVGEDNGVPFTAMKLLQGQSLSERIKKQNGPLPLSEAVRIGQEMADGLAAAHANGLIHRDIKPGNVFLEGEWGKVKLLDFGLVRAANDNGELTPTGALLGTPAYMAPEQARSEEVDGRADLFSLGCVLYQMSTGQPPFQADDMITTLLAVATEQHSPANLLNPEVPTALNNLINQLLNKAPTERPGSAQSVRLQLEALQQHLPPIPRVAPRTMPLPETTPQAKSVSYYLSLVGGVKFAKVTIKTWLALFGASLALLLLVVFLVLLLPTSEDRESKFVTPIQNSPSVVPEKPKLPFGWQDYQLPGDRAIWFPGVPKVVVEPKQTQQGAREITRATVMDGSTKLCFAAAHSRHLGITYTDINEALDKARNGAIQGGGGTLISEIAIRHDGLLGREVFFHLGNPKAIVVRMQIWFVSQDLYQIMVIGSKRAIENSDVQQFFDSFGERHVRRSVQVPKPKTHQ